MPSFSKVAIISLASAIAITALPSPQQTISGLGIISIENAGPGTLTNCILDDGSFSPACSDELLDQNNFNCVITFGTC